MDLTETQGPSKSVTFLGVWPWGAHRDILSKVKGVLMDLAPSTPKKEAQCPVGCFGFWRQHVPHLDVLLWPICQAASSEWGRTREGSAEGAGGCQAALLLARGAQQILGA